MSSIVYQADFPIGFAENRDNSSSEYYVEWLENSTEFPELTFNTDLSGWEILEKKEIEQEEHPLVFLEEDDAWAEIGSKHSYVEIAEKNADELKPNKRTIQPLWHGKKVHAKREITQDNDDMDPFYVHKGKTRHHLRKMHRLKTTDYLLQLATSSGNDGNMENPNLKYLSSQEIKAQALAFTTKFNVKKLHKGRSRTKNHRTDPGEYSVNDIITKTF